MKRTKLIFVFFILCNLYAMGQVARINSRAYNTQPDTTSVFSAKHAWNLARIVYLMKWIEDNRLRYRDSVYVSEMNASYHELKTYCQNNVNYALLDKQINRINDVLDRLWKDFSAKSTPYGLIEKEILSHKPDEADQLILEGIRFRNEFKTGKAYECFKKALEKAPTRVNYYYFGVMEELEVKQDTTQALDYLNKAIGLSKEKSSLLFQPYQIRAWIYNTQKKYGLAIDDLNREFEKDTTNEQILYDRAYAKEQLKDFAGAISDAQRSLKILRLKPYSVTADSASVLNRIGWNYYLSKQYELCVQYADKSLLLRPDNSYTIDTRGSGYYGLREYEKCIRDMTIAIRLNPNLANSLCLRGLSYLKVNKQDQACVDLSKAARLGKVEAAEAMKGLCAQVNENVENQRQFPVRKPSNNKNNIIIDAYGIHFMLQ